MAPATSIAGSVSGSNTQRIRLRLQRTHQSPHHPAPQPGGSIAEVIGIFPEEGCSERDVRSGFGWGRRLNHACLRPGWESVYWSGQPF